MQHDPNDPRLTAYALGELDEADRPGVEVQLVECAESRRTVEEVRAAARLLTAELAKEPTLGLGPEHHMAIENHLRPKDANKNHPEPVHWTRFAVAAAILIGMGAATIRLLMPLGTDRHADVAMNTTKAGGGMVADRPLATEEDSYKNQAPSSRYGGSKYPSAAKRNETTGLEAGAAFSSDATDLAIVPAPSPAPSTEGAVGFAPLAAAPASAGISGGGSRGFAMPAGPNVGKPAAAGVQSHLRSKSRESEFGMGGAMGRIGGGMGGGGMESMRGGRGLRPEGGYANSANGTIPAPGTPAADLRGRKLATNTPGLGRRPEPAAVPSEASVGKKAKTESGPDASGVVKEGRVSQTDFDKLALFEKQKDGTKALARESIVPADKPADVQRDAKAGEVKKGLEEGFDREKRDGVPLHDAIPGELPAGEPAPNNEVYNPITDNPFVPVAKEPLSTFSIDVDTASYSNMRRILNQGALPPADSIRIEELVNYFKYSYPQPKGDEPFSVNIEVARCPWSADHRLARIGLKGREIAVDKRPATNLVFLLDVSGSMAADNKLPLVKASMRLLLDKLGEGDRVAIVTYAGDTRLALPSTSCTNKTPIINAIDGLQSGGSTNGSSGIDLAYEAAAAGFIRGGVNRVILCTDGDFNVGLVGEAAVKLVEEKAKRKISLSVLGFGMDNLKDGMMEQMADKGDGNYAYIDNMLEARKVLVEQLSGTLVTIAKDVKIQVEFNPAKVASYRLIGYENRMLAKEDFNNDAKDAGEIGAGHTVTALYELVPVGKEEAPAQAAAVDELEFQAKAEPALAAKVDRAGPIRKESLMVKLRYKQPDGDVSKLLKRGAEDEGKDYAAASDDFKFAASVTSFGMVLRNSPHKGTSTFASALEIAESSRGEDASEYRREFTDLVRRAKAIANRP